MSRTKDDVLVIETLQRYGGSFARALGEACACACADDANLARIKAAFPEVWREYLEIARLRGGK